MPSIISAGTTSGTSLNLSGDTSGVLQLQTNGTTPAVTINTSQNVGIGTASPSTRLHVAGAGTTAITVSNSSAGSSGSPQLTQLNFLGFGNEDRGRIECTDVASSTFGSDMRFYNANSSNGALTERMRIDSSGQVGIGVTPYTNSLAKSLDVGDGMGTFGYVGNYYLTGNAYFNGGWKYKTSKAAGMITQDSNDKGLFVVNGCEAGTANAAITWTEILQVKKDTSVALQGATTKAGTGITFPATQSASSDANTLDDYEEGTWTPTATSGSGSITSYSSSGSYVKIGKSVFVNGTIQLTNVGTAGGLLNGGGLPFASRTVSNGGRPATFVVRENAATGVFYGGWVNGGNTAFDISTLTFGAINWSNNYIYTFSFTYEVP